MRGDVRSTMIEQRRRFIDKQYRAVHVGRVLVSWNSVVKGGSFVARDVRAGVFARARWEGVAVKIPLTGQKTRHDAELSTWHRVLFIGWRTR